MNNTRTASPNGRCIDETAIAWHQQEIASPGAATDGASTSIAHGGPDVDEILDAGEQLLVTPREAGRRLAVGRTTVYELIASGELESVVIGRCRRVPVSSLHEFVSRLIGPNLKRSLRTTPGTAQTRT
jgi:excisionase family DNA binding protein